MEIIQGAKIQGDDVWMVNGQYCTATLGKFVPVTDTESLRYIQDIILKDNIRRTTFCR